MIYDKKDDIKLTKEIEFPLAVTNFSRKTKECYNKEELFEHIICKPELKEITQMLAARIHPEIFIDDNSYILISHFMRMKRYGMSYLYPGGLDETPNIVLLAFDTIQNILDKDESDRIKSMKENSKKNSNKDRGPARK